MSCSANRLLVQKGIAEKFTAALVARAKTLQMGSGFDRDAAQGTLVDRAAVEKITVHVEDAVP